MYLQEILEVVIGLIFMWMVISIAVMQMNEWFFRNRRANELYKTIRQMLGNEELAQRFYKHPLIAGLYKKTKVKLGVLPSYISNSDFTTVLFDILTQAGTESSPLLNMFGDIYLELDKIQNPEYKKLAEDDWNTIMTAIRKVAGSPIGQATLDSLRFQIEKYRDKYPELQEFINLVLPRLDEFCLNNIVQQNQTGADQSKTSLSLQQVRLGLMALDTVSPQLTTTVRSLISGVEEYVNEGEQVIAKARTNIESWYNNSMDRLVGFYKQKTQLTSFIVGLILALFLNIDSISAANQLWREPILRQAILSQSEAYVMENPNGSSSDIGAENTSNSKIADILTGLQSSIRELQLPFGWIGAPIPMSELTSCRPTEISMDTDNNQQMDALFGIMWGNTCYPITNAAPLNVNHWLEWFIKILGILITGAAATQGAPLWFDILKNVVKVDVRSTGRKPNEG